jgi:nucleoside-diphosphate-sugar epimerase
LYGNGERTLYEHFRKAWTGSALPLLGEGNNRLPTIHVQDAAKLIKKIIYDKPKQPYILAVDEGKCT